MGRWEPVIEIIKKMKGALGSFFMGNAWRDEKVQSWFSSSERMWSPISDWDWNSTAELGIEWVGAGVLPGHLWWCDESTSNPVDSVEVAEIPSLFGGNVGHLHTEHIPHSHTKNLYTAIQKFKWTHAHTHKEENKVSCYCQLMMGS